MTDQQKGYIKGAGKYQKQQYQKRLEEYKLNPKRCLNCNNILNYTATVKCGNRKRKFCSQSCAAVYNNNKKTRTTKGLKKICRCIHCNNNAEISLHAPSKTAICNECKPIKQPRFTKKTKRCIVCKKDFSYIKNNIKTCGPKCVSIAKRNGAIKGGKKSVTVQARRSKNEIHFYELCKNKFINVVNNKPMFNGWDADVILLDHRIAVLWNGSWHYKKITQKHSVIQVQNRDKIKLKEIKKMGFCPYIIKDLGKANTKKVETEFQIFCEWLDNKTSG